MGIEETSAYINTPSRLAIAHWLVTSRCNARCEFCFSRSHDTQLSLSDAKLVVRRLKAAGVSTIKYTGGEPLLFEKLGDLLKFSMALGVNTHLHTNGLLLDGVLLESIHEYVHLLGIPLDGSTTELQVRVTRPKIQFEQTLRILDSTRDSPVTVSVRTLVNKHNLSDLHNIGELLATRHVDYWVLFEFRPLERGRANQEQFQISSVEWDNMLRQITHAYSNRLDIIFVSRLAGHAPYIFIDALARVFTIHPSREENVFVGNILTDDPALVIDVVRELHERTNSARSPNSYFR